MDFRGEDFGVLFGLLGEPLGLFMGLLERTGEPFGVFFELLDLEGEPAGLFFGLFDLAGVPLGDFDTASSHNRFINSLSNLDGDAFGESVNNFPLPGVFLDIVLLGVALGVEEALDKFTTDGDSSGIGVTIFETLLLCDGVF